MVSARQFLMEFLKDIVAHPADRPTILDGYVKLMELREQAIAAGEMEQQ